MLFWNCFELGPIYGFGYDFRDLDPLLASSIVWISNMASVKAWVFWLWFWSMYLYIFFRLKVILEISSNFGNNCFDYIAAWSKGEEDLGYSLGNYLLTPLHCSFWSAGWVFVFGSLCWEFSFVWWIPFGRTSLCFLVAASETSGEGQGVCAS